MALQGRQLLQHLKEYFINTTIHGFRYIVEGHNVLEKLVWAILVIISFTISGQIIFQSFSAWDTTPLQTTIDRVSLPVQELPFPGITICDHQSRQMPRRNRWMFVEQLLNWIDINKFQKYDYNESLALKDYSPFQILTIQSKINEVLERSNLYTSIVVPANCWSKGVDDACKNILEFLTLDNNRTLSSNVDAIYEKALQSWNLVYPAIRWYKFGSHGYVMKNLMHLAYESLFRERHNLLIMQNGSTNFQNFSISDEQSCNLLPRCKEALHHLVIVWKKLDQIVSAPSSLDLGGLVSSFNFMVESWRDDIWQLTYVSNEKTEELQRQINTVMSKMIPELSINNVSFVDMVGLLGYVTTFDIDKWKFHNFDMITRIMQPRYGFSMKYQPNGNVPTENVCNVDHSIYKEWIWFLENTKSQLQTSGNDTHSTKILPPCYQNEEYVALVRKNRPDWEISKIKGIETCCRMLHSIFGWKNIKPIMNIMKFSIGMPVPHSLTAIKAFDAEDYNTLFPNAGNLTFIEKLGFSLRSPDIINNENNMIGFWGFPMVIKNSNPPYWYLQAWYNSLIPICREDSGHMFTECADFRPAFTNQGMCFTRNAGKMHEMFKPTEYMSAFEGIFLPKRGNDVVKYNKGSGIQYQYSFVIDANRYKDMKRGGKWNQSTKTPLYLGIHSPNDIADIRGSGVKVLLGYETTIRINLLQLSSNPDIKNLKVDTRNCKFPGEHDDLGIFSWYSRINCLFECSMEAAETFCGCRPWDFPRPDKSQSRICDFFGGSCFNTLMKTDHGEALCLDKCKPDCNEIKYTISVEKTPLNFESEICVSPRNRVHNVEDEESGKAIWSHIFGMSQDSDIYWEKSTPLLELIRSFQDAVLHPNHSISDEEYCNEKVPMDMAVVNVVVNSPTVLKMDQHIRVSFTDKLANFGGSLGLFTGMSILSMFELLFWLTRAFRGRR